MEIKLWLCVEGLSFALCGYWSQNCSFSSFIGKDMFARTSIFQETVIFLAFRNELKHFHLLCFSAISLPQFLCEYFIAALLCLSVVNFMGVYIELQSNTPDLVQTDYFSTPVLLLGQISSWLGVYMHVSTPVGVCMCVKALTTYTLGMASSTAVHWSRRSSREINNSDAAVNTNSPRLTSHHHIKYYLFG